MNGAAWRPLCFYSQAVGIVRRPETRAGRMTLAGDLHLYPRAFEPGRAHALVAAYPAEGHTATRARSEEHTSELQSRGHLVCRLLLEKKKPRNAPTLRARVSGAMIAASLVEAKIASHIP